MPMRLLTHALKNAVRNSFLSVSSVFSIALILFFVQILLFVQSVAGDVIASINHRVTISLNLKPGYDLTNTEVLELLKNIRTVGQVKAEFVSAADAFKILQEREPELAELINDHKENPLPSSIRLDNIGLDEYDTLNEVIGRYRNVVVFEGGGTGSRSLVDYRKQYEKIQSLVVFLSSIRFAVYGLIAFFAFSVFLLVYAIIGNFVFFFREELRIAELVGATRTFIYGPFIIQGMLYAFVAGVISIGAFVLALRFANISFIEDFHVFAGTFLGSSAPLFGAVLIGTTCVGALSAWTASSRFIKESRKHE